MLDGILGSFLIYSKRVGSSEAELIADWSNALGPLLLGKNFLRIDSLISTLWLISLKFWSEVCLDDTTLSLSLSSRDVVADCSLGSTDNVV